MNTTSNPIKKTNNGLTTRNMILCALFAAVVSAVAGIVIYLPFTPIPISMATMAVMLTGAVLGSKYGTISIAVYLLLGAIGVPVFSGYTGGLSKLAGPTGGYLIGYLLTAFIVGIIIEKANGESKLWKYITAMVIGVFACYVLGTAWFMLQTGTGLAASMMSCVIPFLPGEAAKIIIAALLASKLRPALERMA